MKKIFLAVAIMLSAFLIPAGVAAADENSSAQMMETIETILYGESSKGGLIERLSTAEEALFGRSLPGTVAERHTAILNFLDIGTEDQPSMLFKLGVAEWIVGKKINATQPAMPRLEALEMNLNGEIQHGKPIAMRVESILATLVTEPVTFRVVRLPKDVPLKLRFLDELSPAKSKAGDSVRVELTDDLVVDDCLVAPAGSFLLTEVREVKKPGRFGVPGEVRLNFNGLKPLGPQRPAVTVGAVSQKAIEEARKLGDKGEGTLISAGAASIAGAVILGPVGLISGIFIRGNSIRIPEGSITYVQTAEDTDVSAYPLPESLRMNIKGSIQGARDSETLQKENTNYDPDRDLIIKRDADVFNRGTRQQPAAGADESVELPPEQPVR
ncbi:MAG: hypothetical protein K5841_06600 [Fretibacterium sp.]|nr:hypothetical protein [Fretibacterium sp.]